MWLSRLLMTGMLQSVMEVRHLIRRVMFDCDSREMSHVERWPHFWLALSDLGSHIVWSLYFISWDQLFFFSNIRSISEAPVTLYLLSLPLSLFPLFPLFPLFCHFFWICVFVLSLLPSVSLSLSLFFKPACAMACTSGSFFSHWFFFLIKPFYLINVPHQTLPFSRDFLFWKLWF